MNSYDNSVIVFNNGQISASFVYFCPFRITIKFLKRK